MNIPTIKIEYRDVPPDDTHDIGATVEYEGHTWRKIQTHKVIFCDMKDGESRRYYSPKDTNPKEHDVEPFCIEIGRFLFARTIQTD